mmetsp:Transcript_15140/g.38405  ORF Transcript_15140/g.38405 Transcript_15140/m.38405 type:complete len:231 (+) Transcript_15140:486-1178(+)
MVNVLLRIFVVEHLKHVALHFLGPMHDILDAGTRRLDAQVIGNGRHILKLERAACHSSQQRAADGGGDAAQLGINVVQDVLIRNPLLHAQAQENLANVQLGQVMQQAALHVVDVSHWRQRKVVGRSGNDELGDFRSGKRAEHLRGALGMADVGERGVPSDLQDVVINGGNVVAALLIPRKVPKRSRSGIHDSAVAGEGVASGVGHPDVVAGVGEHVGESLVRQVDDPAEG